MARKKTLFKNANKRKPKSRLTKSTVSKMIKKVVDPSQGLSTKEYKYKHLVRYATIASSVLGASTFGYSFTLNSISNYASYTALYDEYRIDKVQVIFQPIANEQMDSIAGTAITPVFYYYKDFDDASAPVTLASVITAQDIRFNLANKKCSITLKPAQASDVYQSPVNTGYGSRYGFIDTGYPAVPHYGLKGLMESSTNAGQCTYIVFLRIWTTFRGVRQP